MIYSADKRFWDFTYDEMIKYDLPAVIDYVTASTNQSQIAYIGYSQVITCGNWLLIGSCRAAGL